MTIQVTKVSVREMLKGQWAIILNLKLMEGTEELFNQDFSGEYKTGDDVAKIGLKFKDKMQEAIDKYKAEQTIFNHVKLDTVVTALQNQLGV